ncbi:hypothetical protein BpHYR1_003019 [Brachionus plicatilis]|uniref:Uncharacterized protein n=1 Tax=Brachionus plicatilis TaxID=10195 RepID=A0A3M7PBG0_BRAPC|nr:hypothetical protein BpHYR1_003019 [Brachionus plicatilis]
MSDDEYASLELCESQESDSEEVEERNILKKRRGINREWIYVDMFDDNDAADLRSKNETKWSKEDTFSTNDGDKIIYRCNLVKRRGPQCDAKLMLLFNADNLKATRFDNICHNIS